MESHYLKTRDLTRRTTINVYVHIPLLVKLSTKRVNNIKPFIVGGFSTALNLSSQEDNPDDNSNSNTFRVTKNNLYYELGIGIDLILERGSSSPHRCEAIFSMQR